MSLADLFLTFLLWAVNMSFLDLFVRGRPFEVAGFEALEINDARFDEKARELVDAVSRILVFDAGLVPYNESMLV